MLQKTGTRAAPPPAQQRSGVHARADRLEHAVRAERGLRRSGGRKVEPTALPTWRLLHQAQKAGGMAARPAAEAGAAPIRAFSEPRSRLRADVVSTAQRKSVGVHGGWAPSLPATRLLHQALPAARWVAAAAWAGRFESSDAARPAERTRGEAVQCRSAPKRAGRAVGAIRSIRLLCLAVLMAAPPAAPTFQVAVGDRAQRSEAESGLASLLAGPAFAALVRDVRALAIPGGLLPDEPDYSLFARNGLWEQDVERSMRDPWTVPAEVRVVREHLARAEGMVHPEESQCRLQQAPASLKAAVSCVAKWDGRAAQERELRMRRFERVAAACAAFDGRIYATVSPQHITQAPGPRQSVALIECCSRALGLDSTLAADCALGVVPCGEVPTFDSFEVEYQRAAVDFDSLDHDEWALELEADIRSRAEEASAEERENIEGVFEKTAAEIRAGLSDGWFTKEGLDAKFGAGYWRPSRAFAIWQKGKLRVCDNCAESRINDGTALGNRMRLDGADFPAMVAALFGDALGWDRSPWHLEGGTDDVEAAYRRLKCWAPQYVVAALWHPGRREVVYVTRYGLSFGLKAAPVLFNRYMSAVVQIARRLFGWCGTAFFDDAATVEPTFARGSGQRALRRIAELLGMPFSDEKHVPMRPVFVFLGVQSDLSQLWSMGLVLLGVTVERQARLLEAVDFVCDTQSCTSGEAAQLHGRFGFATRWTHGRFGRTVLQPLIERALDDAVAHGLTRALEGALRFLRRLIGSGGLPKRRFKVRADGLPTVRIWSDAMYEPGKPAKIAFVVYFPPSSGGRQGWFHASLVVPEAFMARFMRRKQYIGQLELLAAVAVYYSLAADLAGRRVVHLIDNQSAIAALIKGYARAPDSVRIVHAFAAFNLGLDASSWFEWVPSKANIADLPTRDEREAEAVELLRELRSTEVELRLPDVAAWDAPADEWMRAAAARTVGRPQAGDGEGLGRVLLGHTGKSIPVPGMDVAIDRASGSVLANPFEIGVVRSATRNAVCAACAKAMRGGHDAVRAEAARRQWPEPAARFIGPRAQEARMAAIEACARRVEAGQDVRLMCACYPRRCHGQDVADMVMERARELRAARVGKRRRR